MSTSDSVPLCEPEPNHHRAITFVYDGKGVSCPPGDPRRMERKGRPRAEVAYDPARHVIKIMEPAGKTAEFDDRPIRFLLLYRNPETKALEPVIVEGEPFYYHLSREIER